MYMINLGILSANSAYTGQTNSAYGSTRISSVEDKQGTSDAEKLAPKDEIKDEAIISDDAMALLASDKEEESQKKDKISDKDKSESKISKESEDDNVSKFDKKLTPEEEQEIAKLEARDAEVKAHEQAHIAAAAGLKASVPSYDFETGPDGQKYAVGGEVSISFTRGKDPEEDISNAEAMKSAALAPSQPSGQDLAVAKEADKIIEDARQKLTEQQVEKPKTNDEFDKLGEPNNTEKICS